MNGLGSISRYLKTQSSHARLVEQHRTSGLNKILHSDGAWGTHSLALLPHDHHDFSHLEQMERVYDKTVIELELDHGVVPQVHETTPATVPKKPYGAKQTLFSLLRLYMYMASVIKVPKLIRFKRFAIPITLRSTAVQTDTKPATPIPGWNIVGGSVTGTKHHKKKQPCQDAWKYHQLPGAELIIAVADGAGSAPLSKQGAKRAVNAAVKYLCTAIPQYKPNTSKEWKSIVSYAFEVARTQLIEYAASQAERLRNYNTTLQLVVASDNWTISAIVGDGTAVGLRNDHSLVRLMSPQRGEYANATNFITSDSAMEKIAIQVLQEPVIGIAVLTDGLLSLAIDERDETPHERFFTPLFNFLTASIDNQQANKDLAQFLSSDRVNRRTDDDKTLALALRTGA